MRDYDDYVLTIEEALARLSKVRDIPHDTMERMRELSEVTSFAAGDVIFREERVRMLSG